MFYRILEKAELRRIRFHDLRHAFASLFIQPGESLAYVRDQMGHASIQVTVDIYGHLVPGANRAAVDRLDDQVPAQPPAPPAQPETAVATGQRARKWLRKSGEPPESRTRNPQIKSYESAVHCVSARHFPSENPQGLAPERSWDTVVSGPSGSTNWSTP